MSHNGLTTEQARKVWPQQDPRPGREDLDLTIEKARCINANRAAQPPVIALCADTKPLDIDDTLGLNNSLLDCDSYKASHALQLPPGTTHIYSYIESRGGEHDRVLFFGLQAFLKRYMNQPINLRQVDEASIFWALHGEPFDRSMWDHIILEHGGRLPLEIRALPEGMVVPIGTPLVTVVNTDPRCAALTSFVETKLLRAIWYPTTVASNSFECKEVIKRAFERTSTDHSGLPFKLHDFGARGVSSQESAALGGMAHLVNFMGTDTVSGILAARLYYGEHMAGFSIPATEHSTITSWGRDREGDAYENTLEQFRDYPLVAIVSDSYDIWNAVSNIFGDRLKQKIINGRPTLVVRPDSGDPATVPVEVVKALDAAFGHTVNARGFRVLHPKVRVIQGDGITLATLGRIIFNLELAGYAIDNIAFGMGGGLLQQVNRDTYKFAMKCSAMKVNGQWREVCKEPVGQPDKHSKRGRFSVRRREDGSWDTLSFTIDPFGDIPEARAEGDDDVGSDNMLKPVWRDGELLVDHTFAEVRARAAA